MANVPQETLDKLPWSILGRAIRLAIERGWKYNDIDLEFKKVGTVSLVGNIVYLYEGRPLKSRPINSYCLEEIIYNHDFARALFGEREDRQPTREEGSSYYGGGAGGFITVKEGWQFHLQQMVISENPIAYLGDHI